MSTDPQELDWRIGDRVWVMDGPPEERFFGQIVHIEPDADGDPCVLTVRCEDRDGFINVDLREVASVEPHSKRVMN